MRHLRRYRLIAAVVCGGMLAMPTAPLAQGPSGGADLFPIAGPDLRGPEGGPDGLPASRTDLYAQDVAAAADGALLVADASGPIRRIGLDNVVTDVAGPNPFRQRPSDTAALRAELGQPVAVAALSDGGFLVATSSLELGVQRVWPDQSITTLWRGFAQNLAVLPDGRVLTSEDNSDAITQIDAQGRASRFAVLSEAAMRDV